MLFFIALGPQIPIPWMSFYLYWYNNTARWNHRFCWPSLLLYQKRYVDFHVTVIRGPRAIKNNILYCPGASDYRSMDIVAPELVQQHNKTESSQQCKWRCVLREKARETDEGRTTDIPSLLFGHSVSRRTGTGHRLEGANRRC